MPDLSNKRLAIDVMGSDLGPDEVLHGVLLAIQKIHPLPHLHLVGDHSIISSFLSKHKLSSHPLISIHHASQVITMDEKPIQSLKQKKDSSMVQALELHKNNLVDAVLSCGNTGSLMAGGTLKIRPIQGLERPALSSIIPRKNGRYILIDAGAEPQSQPNHLVHNAILGSHYAKIEFGIPNPSVGLLTIGTEEGKGTDTINQTHLYLKQLSHVINYKGLIEGHDLFQSDINVIVCDGFVGNILVKGLSSVFKMIKGVLSEELKRNPIRKIGALLSIGAFKAFRNRFNPDRYGFAPLLGLNGIVFKAHGSSKRHAVMYAIQAVSRSLKNTLPNLILADIQESNKIIKANKEDPTL